MIISRRLAVHFAVVCTFGFILAAGVQSASASYSWTAPVPLTASGETAQHARLAADGSGNATALWWNYDYSEYTVQSATKSVGSSSWSDPITVFTNSDTGGNLKDPELAVDRKGNAVAVWWSYEDIGDGTMQSVLRSAKRPVGSAWEGSAVIAEADSDAAAIVAFDSNSNIAVVWKGNDDLGDRIWASTRARSQTSWSSPVAISEAGHNAESPQVVAGSNGSILSAWTRYDGLSFRMQAAEKRKLGNRWEAATSISKVGENAQEPRITTDTLGNLLATWTGYSNIQASKRVAGSSSWETPAEISTSGFGARNSQPALDGQGNATVVWEQKDESNQTRIFESSRLATSADWNTATMRSDTQQPAYEPRIDLDDSGNAVVVWRRYDGSANRIQAVTRNGGTGIWSSAATLSNSGIPASEDEVVFDGFGSAVALWREVVSNKGSIQASTASGTP